MPTLSVAAGKVEGADAAFLLDTGSDGGLDVFKSWASTRGLPGNRAVVDVDGNVGLGTGIASTQFFRLASASLGPLAWDNRRAHIMGWHFDTKVDAAYADGKCARAGRRRAALASTVSPRLRGIG